jgi:hypothetical protein
MANIEYLTYVTITKNRNVLGFVGFNYLWGMLMLIGLALLRQVFRLALLKYVVKSS